MNEHGGGETNVRDGATISATVTLDPKAMVATANGLAVAPGSGWGLPGAFTYTYTNNQTRPVASNSTSGGGVVYCGDIVVYDVKSPGGPTIKVGNPPEVHWQASWSMEAKWNGMNPANTTKPYHDALGAGPNKGGLTHKVECVMFAPPPYTGN